MNPFDDTERGAYNTSQAAASWIVDAGIQYLYFWEYTNIY